MTAIPPDDRGLLLGDGLFETVLAKTGALVLFEEHAARLIEGCARLGLEAPQTHDLRAVAEGALATAGLGGERAAVRLTLTAGSGGRGLDRPESPVLRLFAAASPAPAPQGPARVIVASIRRNEGSPASRLKTLAYLDNVLARREARAAGADEAVMLNGRGELACAAAANLFWITGGRLLTPALECGALAGVMRAQVVRQAAATGLQTAEVRARPEALDGAEAIFLTNSLVGVRGVGLFCGRRLEPHPVVARLTAALAEIS